MMIMEICLKPKVEDKEMKTNRLFPIIFIILTTIILSSFQTQQDHKVLFEKAKYTMETKADLKAAIDLFETLIKNYPNEKEYVAKSLLYQGMCYERLGNQEAIKKYQQLVQKYPGQKNEVALAEKRLNYLDEQLASLKKQAEQHLEKGNELFSMWEYESAIEEYKKALEPDPNSLLALNAQYCIGQTWFRMGKYDLAMGTFKKLVKEYPKSNIAPVTELMIEQVQYAVENNKDTQPIMDFSDKNTIVDPETGITYRKVKTFTGKNDVISYTSGGFNMSPDGRFLVLENKVVPTDGSDPFTLVDMDALRAVYSPDMKNAAFYAESAIWIVPVSPETGHSIGQPKKLLEGSYVFQLQVSWSPDGKKIAFGRRDKTIAGDIWVISVSDGKLTPITNSPQYDDGPVWSPDGNKFAFRSEGEIWLASADGSETKMIIKQGWNTRLIWTPDSKWLFYYHMDQSHLYSLDHNKNYNLNIPEQIGKFISFSATGEKILFYRTSFDDKWESKIVSASGGPTYSPIPNISVFDAKWSTDSKQIVVESENKQGDAIYKIISLAGGNAVDVEIKANVNGKLLPLVFSRNLKSLAFLTAKENDKFDLYIIPFSMQEGQTIGPAKKVFENWSRGNLSWSPENTRLALEHERGIWIVPLDGGSPVQIANTSEGLRGLGWSPDGKMISYFVESKNTRIAYVVPATGGIPQVVHNNCITGDWGHDSKSMALLANDEIQIVSLTGEKIKHIVNLKDLGLINISSLEYSPDGKQLAFIGNNGDKSLIFEYSFENEKIERFVFENQDDEKYFLKWSPDGKWLSYLSEENIKVRLESYLWEADFDEVTEKLLKQK